MAASTNYIANSATGRAHPAFDFSRRKYQSSMRPRGRWVAGRAECWADACLPINPGYNLNRREPIRLRHHRDAGRQHHLLRAEQHRGAGLSHLSGTGFTGTNATSLNSHTANTGQTWAFYNSISGDTGGPLTLNGSNAAINAVGLNTATGDAISSLTPSSANYTPSAVLTALVSSGADSGYPNIRASNSANTNYQVTYNCSAANVVTILLYKIVTGTATRLGTTYTEATNSCAIGTANTLSITVGSTSQMVKLNGTTVSGPQGTDSSITAAGQVVMKLAGDGTMGASNFYVQ